MATADPKDPELASAEIRQLLLHLDPQTGGGHKDRVRCLARFRNFVSGEKTRPRSTPDFYDDDLPLLFLGSLVPVLDEELVGQRLYGLLQACGSPSVEHENTLKRSARPAMALTKYLVCDFSEYDNGVKVSADPKQLNPFAFALCSLLPSQLSHMNLELHIEGDRRGGAKEDACHVISLLVTRHLADDGETTKYLPLETLLPTKAARNAYDNWLKQSAPKALQKQVTKALATLKAQQPQAPTPREEKKRTPKKEIVEKQEQKQQEQDLDEEDSIDKEFGSPHHKKKATIGSSRSMDGPPVKWEDSELYQEQVRKANTTARSSVRDSQQVAAEKRRLEQEKLKAQGKDPLGLKPDLDLREIQALKLELLEQAVKDLHDQIQEERNQGDEDEEHIQSLITQKESLEHILDMIDMGINRDQDSDTEEEGTSKANSLERSIIPTDSNFDPLLYLTLVHRNASYETLMESIDRLSNKTENQVVQLQNLVRDNFALFVRCADGIDIFKGASGANLETRLDNLDALAESCSDQARKSFKPLLDNTNEVRKVQSALKVLQRVGPVVQAPHQMRQHLENGRFSAALKAYRRVLIIDEHCKINLFNRVKDKAADAAREARRDLERRLSEEKAPVSSLLEGIQSLSELLDLDVPPDPREVLKVEDEKGGEALPELPVGSFDVGGLVINVREHPPALACLLLQAAHFRVLVAKTIKKADENATRIYHGETLTSIQGGEDATIRQNVSTDEMSVRTTESKKTVGSGGGGNQWKYDVLDARVVATIRAVEAARAWLPRLLTIGTAAREDEKRRAARVGRRRGDDDNQLTAFEVFLTNITPAVSQLVDHTAFCALGSATRTSGKKVKMSFGSHSPDKLQSLLKSPLPPVQSTQCAKELADMVRTIIESSAAANGLRHAGNEAFDYNLSPLDECRVLAEEAVITVERRRCIFAFDVCARTCASRASGSGKFDGDALLKCLQTLSEELSRPEECASEVEKGCELVVRRSCEGLASYVRDRGDSARLRAVAECADALSGALQDVVREVEYLGCNSQAVEEVMEEDVMGLEGAMFDEFLDNVRMNVAGCCKVGWMGMTETDEDVASPAFPAYLSASLLAIVRCRAQVEKALGNKVRRIEGMTYQFLALATAADAVSIGICDEVKARKTHLKVQQADRMANELQFLMNTLKIYLSDEGLSLLDGTRRTLCSRAGRGGGVQSDKGPEGLAALEELERLGRVYVLCLGD